MRLAVLDQLMPLARVLRRFFGGEPVDDVQERGEVVGGSSATAARR
jgi:hypothetical protein